MPFPIIYRDPKQLAAKLDFLDHFDPVLGMNMDGHIRVFVEPPDWGGILTPDFITPTNEKLADGVTPKFLAVTRHFQTIDRPMPDGQTVKFFGFHDPGRLFTFPSDPIRVVEGQLFHGKLDSLAFGGKHTVHWHGIEPTGQNDGVGKLSMEVGNPGYTYQWLASAAGTYFYHCHRNTLLHFEMGMYGMLLIDPLPPTTSSLPQPGPQGALNQFGQPAFGYGYPLGGPGWVRRGNGVVRYDVEAIWVSDDVDPLWHTFNHHHGMSNPGDPGTTDAQDQPTGVGFTSGEGLNVWNPKYFLISGVPHPWTRNRPGARRNPGVAVDVRSGQTLLVRLLCGAYGVNRYIFQGLDAEVIAMDGRVLGQTPYTQYSSPFVIPAGVPFEFTPARRYDLLFRPTRRQRGSNKVTVEFKHHINRQTLGIAETFINVG